MALEFEEPAEDTKDDPTDNAGGFQSELQSIMYDCGNGVLVSNPKDCRNTNMLPNLSLIDPSAE